LICFVDRYHSDDRTIPIRVSLSNINQIVEHRISQSGPIHARRFHEDFAIKGVLKPLKAILNSEPLCDQ
jgi:hypothetical protein